MSDKLSDDEVEAQVADLLPDREAMSLIDPSAAMAAYGGDVLATPDSTTGDATHGATGTAGDSAGIAGHLTDGTTNPAGTYSPTSTSSAAS